MRNLLLGSAGKPPRPHEALVELLHHSPLLLEARYSNLQWIESRKLEVRLCGLRSEGLQLTPDVQKRVVEKLTVSESFPRSNSNQAVRHATCLLYTSDAADEEDSVDLGGRRII